MGKPFQYVESIVRARVQFDSKPFPVCRGSGTQIHNDVPGGPLGAANDFGLGMRFGLEMQSAQSAPFPVERGIALGNVGIEPTLDEFLTAKSTRKKSPVIAKGRHLYDIRAGQMGRNEPQGRVSAQMPVRAKSFQE